MSARLALLLVVIAGSVGCGDDESEEEAVVPDEAMIALSRGLSFDALGFHVGEQIDAVVDGLAVPGAADLTATLGIVDAVGITPGDCFVGACKHVFLHVSATDRYLVVRNLYSEDDAATVATEDAPPDAPTSPELALPAPVDATALEAWLEGQRQGLDAAVADPSAQVLVTQVEAGYVDAGAYLTIERFVSTGCSGAACATTYLALQREDFGSVEPSDVGTLVVEGGTARVVDP